MIARHYQQSSVKNNKLIEYPPFYDVITDTGYSSISEILDIIYIKFPDFLGLYTRLDIKQILFHYLTRCGEAVKIKEIVLVDKKWHKKIFKESCLLRNYNYYKFLQYEKIP